MNKELLKQLLTIDGVSGKENDIREFIKTKLDELGVHYQVDEKGNVYGENIQGAEKYVLYNAHMDMVNCGYSKYGTYKSNGEKYDLIYCKMEDLVYENFSNKEHPIHDVSQNVLLIANCLNCCHSFDTTEGNELYCWQKDSGDGSNKWEKCFVSEDDWCANYSCSRNSMDNLIHIIKKSKLSDEDKKYLLDFNDHAEQKAETYEVYEEGGKLKGRGKDRVLGGDDRNGIFVALEMLRKVKEEGNKVPIRILFTVSEEIGCIGVSAFLENDFAIDWLKQCLCCITVDRKGNSDLLYKQHGKQSCSWNLASVLAMTGIQAGIPIKMEDGMTADIVKLREYIDGVNISCGYYSPHTTSEYVVLKDVEKVLKWQSNFLDYLLSIDMKLETQVQEFPKITTSKYVYGSEEYWQEYIDGFVEGDFTKEVPY